MKIIVDCHIPFLPAQLSQVAQLISLEPAMITSEAVRDADALLIRTRTRCNAALLEGSKVQWIGTATIGTDHIDLDYCRSRGITVHNAPGCNAPAVAQWVMTAVAQWMQQQSREIALQDLTMGIVGVGHVGSIVARWARQLGMRTLLCDPPRARKEQDSETFVDLTTVARHSNIITFHTPLTTTGIDATYHLCDSHLLQLTRPHALLLNAARGGIVDERALEHWTGSCAIDCWENEPHISRTLLDRCIVGTPHIAGYSIEGKMRGTAMMLQALNTDWHLDLPLPRIDAPALGTTPTSLTAVAASYDIVHDYNQLRRAPDTFEQLRNHYPLRHEYV